MIKLRVIKDVDKLNEKTYTVGDTQYWKRNGKTYKWTADGGRQECSEDEYYKALSGGTSSNDAVKNTEPTEDKANNDPSSAKVGTTKTLGDWSYTKVGNNSWETTYKGKKQSDRTNADIKRVFSGADTLSIDDKSEYTGPTKKVIQGKTFKVDTSSGKPTITASMYDTNERLSKLNKFAKENGITIEYEESKKKSEPVVDKGKKYKDMYAKATADYEKSQTSKDKSDLERINKHSAKRMGDYIDKLYHDTMHPPKDDKIEHDDSESDNIKYNGVSDFDHTTWSVDGYETTIQKNDRGRGYYLQNEDYDMEFDTKRDLINYLKNSGAEFYGYDSEKDY